MMADLWRWCWTAWAALALCGCHGAELAAQPPEVLEIENQELVAPQLELGPSEEARHEIERTKDQQAVFRTLQPIDWQRLVLYLAIGALAWFFGAEAVSKAPLEARLPLLSSAVSIAGAVTIAALIVGGARFPIVSAALVFLAILLGASSMVGAARLIKRLLPKSRVLCEQRITVLERAP